MSILEQLKKSLSPELIGARPFCDFFYMISCVENFIFVLHPYSLQHHYQAWANWISNFLLLCFLFKCFFFSLLCWYIEVERYLVVHRKALLEALVEELPIDIPFLFQLTSIRTKAQKGSSIALIQMEDGTTIRAKVTTTNLSVQLSNT